MRLFTFLALLISSNALMSQASALGKPRLVVNIVISQCRGDVLDALESEFTDGGFNLLKKQGVVCTQSRYEFMPTNKLAALGTLASGANPSVHGITAERWVERTTNQLVAVSYDNKALGLDCELGVAQNSANNLLCPSLGDQLKKQSPESKVISVALEASSSIVLGGFSAHNYWMDLGRGTWVSSSKFLSELPLWVKDYNSTRAAKEFMNFDWKNQKQLKTSKRYFPNYKLIPQQAAGNSIVSDFAKQAVIYEALGADDKVDLLNIVYDAPSYIISRHGYQSEQAKEMLLRLDEDIADLIHFIQAQAGLENVIFVMSADHGSSDEVAADDESAQASGLFNVEHYKILANAFLNSQFGSGDWIVDYIDRQLYLNHNLIYNQKLSLREVQERLTTFTLQFKGVSNVFSSVAMQSGYFASGVASLAQNGFYPKRSGDLILNLQPGWIEGYANVVSSAGSPYDYDRHVPLIFYGATLKAGRVKRRVDMRELAPTLAYIMQINPPSASHFQTIEQVTQQ